MKKSLDQKYARMWVETNVSKIPDAMQPFNSNGTLSPREVRLYTEGMWKVLDQMADDGLISRQHLRQAHDDINGWEPGTSKIQAGGEQ